MIEIRQAAVDDIHRLRPLMEEWIGECNPDGLRFDPSADRLLQSFESMATHPQGATLIMFLDGEPIACVGLVKHGWGACKTENFASENLWYVAKRHAGHAAALVRAAKRWAAERGCDYLIFSQNRLSSARAEGSEFLKALEFRPLYQLHIAEVKPCAT
jgi:hypothetical protein